MKTSIWWIGGITLALAATAVADESMKQHKAMAISMNVKDLKWGEGSPDFPKGMQMTVMYGDPSKSGQFAARIKLPDGYKIAPHWHSQDEQLTILQGQFVLHMGDTMKADAHTLDVGGYHFLPAKMHHAAETKGETIIQLQGMGPFDIHYLNPADNPNPKSASK